MAHRVKGKNVFTQVKLTLENRLYHTTWDQQLNLTYEPGSLWGGKTPQTQFNCAASQYHIPIGHSME